MPTRGQVYPECRRGPNVCELGSEMQGHTPHSCWTWIPLWMRHPGLRGTSQRGLCVFVLLKPALAQCLHPHSDPAAVLGAENKREQVFRFIFLKQPLEARWGRVIEGRGWHIAFQPTTLVPASRQLFQMPPAAARENITAIQWKVFNRGLLGAAPYFGDRLKPKHLDLLPSLWNFHLQAALVRMTYFERDSRLHLGGVNNLIGVRALSMLWYYSSLACLVNYGG